jgi:hypothetical protein
VSRDNSRRRDAVRRASEARAARERARKAREDQIEAALASLFASLAEVERLRAAARRKADALLADGERTAARHYATACAAARTLRDLLGSNTAVAELCELRVEDVRDMLAATRAQQVAPADGVAPDDLTDADDGNGAAGDPGEGAGSQSATAIDPATAPGRVEDQARHG